MLYIHPTSIYWAFCYIRYCRGTVHTLESKVSRRQNLHPQGRHEQRGERSGEKEV